MKIKDYPNTMLNDYLVRAERYNKSGFASIKRLKNITFCNFPGKQGKPFSCSPHNHLNKYIARDGNPGRLKAMKAYRSWNRMRWSHKSYIEKNQHILNLKQIFFKGTHIRCSDIAYIWLSPFVYSREHIIDKWTHLITSEHHQSLYIHSWYEW